MINKQLFSSWFVLILLTLSPLFGFAHDLKIHVAQIKVRPGQFEMILADIAAEYQKALSAKADLMVLPEGILPGYPSNDHLFEGDYIERTEKATDVVRQLTEGQNTAILLGHIGKSAKPRGRALQNFVSVFEKGQLLHRQAKMLLPTYGPFDDSRYFERGEVKDLEVFNFRGHRIGILICEDGWFYDTDANGRLIYRHNTLMKMKRLNPDFVFSISASPANQGKQQVRFDVFSHVAKYLNAPLIYVNQFGIVDGVLFDGAGFFLARNGEALGKMADFSADSALLRIADKQKIEVLETTKAQSSSNQNFLLQALKFGLQEFVQGSGHRSTAVVFDGSLESLLTIALSAQSLGGEKTFVLTKPYTFMSHLDVANVLGLVHRMGIPMQNVLQAADGTAAQIEFFLGQLPAVLQTPALQAELAQKDSKWQHFFDSKPLALQTLNKELLATQIPPPLSKAGTLALIGDLYKSDVLNLSRALGISTQSAEPSLLAYELLLKDVIKGNLTRDQIREKHSSMGLEEINTTFAAYDATEFNRQTSAGVILRVTHTPLSREARKIMNGVREGNVPSVNQVIKSCLAVSSGS